MMDSLKLLMVIILISIFFIREAAADYVEPTSRTQINQQTDLFEKSVDNLKSFEQQLEEGKAAATGSLDSPSKALDYISDKSQGEIESEANTLSSIGHNDLADKGRARLIDSNLLEEIYFDETKPLYIQHKKDADSIAEASSKLMGNLLGMLKDLGVDCKTIKGNKVVEPEYFIDLKRTPTKDTVYNKTICEELRNKYNCRDILIMRCSKKGSLELKHIDIPYMETPGHWWIRQEYSEGNLSLNKSGGGFSFTYLVINNSPDVLSQILTEINKRINEQGIVTIQAQDIIYNSLATDYVPSRNVIFLEGPQQFRFGFARYSRSKTLIRFHYYLSNEGVCLEWHENWEERCNLQ